MLDNMTKKELIEFICGYNAYIQLGNTENPDGWQPLGIVAFYEQEYNNGYRY